MKSKIEVIESGMSISSTLGVVFVVMKLLGAGSVANWSWWLVLLPFYWVISALLVFIVFCYSLLFILAAYDFIAKHIKKIK